ADDDADLARPRSVPGDNGPRRIIGPEDVPRMRRDDSGEHFIDRRVAVIDQFRRERHAIPPSKLCRQPKAIPARLGTTPSFAIGDAGFASYPAISEPSEGRPLARLSPRVVLRIHRIDRSDIAGGATTGVEGLLEERLGDRLGELRADDAGAHGDDLRIVGKRR